MNQFPLFVGIDVSKDCLDVAVRPTGEAWQVSHDSRGINDLVERLGELAPQTVMVAQVFSLRSCFGRLRRSGVPTKHDGPLPIGEATSVRPASPGCEFPEPCLQSTPFDYLHCGLWLVAFDPY